MNARPILDPMLAIEAERIALGLTVVRLEALSGVSREWYRQLRRDPSRITATTISKLQNGLKLARRGGRASQREDLGKLYELVLAATCHSFGADLDAARNADPRRGATADPAWRQAARMRQIAIYVINQVGGVRQVDIAHAVGLTPAAVCLAIPTVEDLADKPEWRPRLQALVIMFGGTP